MGSLRILLFVSLLHPLLVAASASEAKNKLFFINGDAGTVTLGKKISLFLGFVKFLYDINHRKI